MGRSIYDAAGKPREDQCQRLLDGMKMVKGNSWSVVEHCKVLRRNEEVTIYDTVTIIAISGQLFHFDQFPSPHTRPLYIHFNCPPTMPATKVTA